MGFLYASTSTRSRSSSMLPINCSPRGMMGSTDENIEEPPVTGIEDVIHVLVGKDVTESKSTLVWALRNSGGRKICLLHVHQPAKKIPMMGIEFPIIYVNEPQVQAYHEIEKQNMRQLLDTYSQICEQAGVHAEKLHIEMDSIEEGIVELISQHGIRNLVMGAPSDKPYSKKMEELKSKKALYACLQLPVSRDICFIFKGDLIYTRESRLDGGDSKVASQSLQASLNIVSGQSSSLRARSVTEGQNNQLKLASSAADYCLGEASGKTVNAEGSYDKSDEISWSRFLSKTSESSYADELSPRKEIEAALAGVARIKEELRVALKQKSSPESQIAESDKMVHELEQKISSAAELLLNYKKERYELQVERDNALREAEELTKKIAETTSCTSVHQFFFLTLVIFCFIFLLYVSSIGMDFASALRPYSIV